MKNQNQSKQGHRRRLRERFLRSGLEGFLDYEVVELLLTLGTPRRDCKSMAKEAIKRFGSLRRVIEASEESLKQIKGIGDHNIFGIKFAKEICLRLLKDKIKDNAYGVVRCSSDAVDEVRQYLSVAMGEREEEVFVVVFLDAKNRVLGIEEMFRGTVDRSVVYPREILKKALEKNAVSMIFAHNHPSGDPAPSEEDHFITKKLVFIGEMAGISVLDHIIVGKGGYYSFADSGLIERYKGREGFK